MHLLDNLLQRGAMTRERTRLWGAQAGMRSQPVSHTVPLERRTVCQELWKENVGLHPQSRGGLAAVQQENQTVEYVESLKYQLANAFSPRREVAKPYQVVPLSTTSHESSVSRKERGVSSTNALQGMLLSSSLS